jgi:hypothetical protein
MTRSPIGIFKSTRFTFGEAYGHLHEDRERFKDLITECRKLAEGVLTQNADHNDARYFVASAYGVLAALAITVDHRRKQALDYGKKSYELHNQALSKPASGEEVLKP